MADVPSRVGLDYWIRLAQLIGVLCLPGAAVAIWNGWLTCRGRRSGWAKVGSVVMALALVELVWFSFAFHLLSGGLNY